jgi:hypothetical protein
MHKLYFVRMVAASYVDAIVFLFTAEDDEAAKALGLSMIADAYRHLYRVDKVEVVCMTPDEVLCYEPV